MADNVAETQEVCRNFRNNGACRYGDKCRFEHSEGEPIQVPSSPPGQCFKFQEGECAKGDRCRFMHGENDPRFDSEGKRDVSNEVCQNFNRGRCALGDKCLRQHVESEQKTSEGPRSRERRRRGPRMCKNFRDNGECPDGDSCRFKHGPDDTRFPPKEAGEEKTAAREPRSKRARKPRKPKPRGECFDFRDNGSCEHGDECRFTHGENDTRFANEAKTEEQPARESTRRRPRRAPREPKADSTDPIDEECNNYKQGRCRFGDQCRRKHVGDVEVVPVEKIDEICNNFQSGRCRFGDFCRRQHVMAQ